eukprot:1944970-Amphidinium_carterae.1
MLQHSRSRLRRCVTWIALVTFIWVRCHVTFSSVTDVPRRLPRRCGSIGLSQQRLGQTVQSHAIQSLSTVSCGKCIARARKQSSLGDFQELTNQAGLDIAVSGAVGSLLSWSSNGLEAALGFACGSLAAAAYTWILVQDVSRTGASTGTPFEATNMLRPVRLLLP